MTMSTAATDGSMVPRAHKPDVRAWDQQPGENNLWYARFLRFVAIGPTGPVGPRSISLVSTGQKNHYPVPAHWPMVAKQRLWRERAAAFDEAGRKDEAVINQFNAMLGSFQMEAPESEARLLQGLVYNRPADDETD